MPRVHLQPHVGRRAVRRWTVGGALAVSLVAGLLLALWGLSALLPTETAAAPVETAYADLTAARAIRADVRGEPVPPSLLERVTAPAEGVPGEALELEEPPPVEESPQRLLVAPVTWIQIERLDLAADVIPLNLDEEGVMEAPDGPELVAWYDFTGKPGLGGNAVFSGHVDWVNYGPAVFWGLDTLEPGDQIEIGLLDGTVLVYDVTANHQYPLEELDMRAILAHTPQESLTLITCGGVFSSGSYSDRVVVRAIRTEVRLREE